MHNSTMRIKSNQIESNRIESSKRRAQHITIYSSDGQMTAVQISNDTEKKAGMTINRYDVSDLLY